MSKYHFNFSTSYNQFYLEDSEIKSLDSDDLWYGEAFNSRLAVHNGIIAVGTYCYGDVKGEIEILDNPSNISNFDQYDHVVEAGVAIASGELQILDCPNSHVQLSIKLNPGKYRVRVYGSNFASVDEYDLPNDTDDDYYKIEIWPDENMDRVVLKNFGGF